MVGEFVDFSELACFEETREENKCQEGKECYYALEEADRKEDLKKCRRIRIVLRVEEIE